MCCVDWKYCLNVVFATWFFERPRPVHRLCNFLNILYALFWLFVVINFINFSPSFYCNSCMPSFWRMSLSQKFTVLCGTTGMSLFVAVVFPDIIVIFNVLFILTFLLLNYLNSTWVAFLCMFCPCFDVNQLAAVCDTKLCGLPVSTSQCIFFPFGFKPKFCQMGSIICICFCF